MSGPPLEQALAWASHEEGREVRMSAMRGSVSVTLVEWCRNNRGEPDFRVVGFGLHATRDGLVRGMHKAAMGAVNQAKRGER